MTQFGVVVLAMSLMIGCDLRISERCSGIIRIVLVFGLLKMVPAASNKGVCLGMPTKFTTVRVFK